MPVAQDQSTDSRDGTEPLAARLVSVRTKLWFGIGATGESATNWIFNALTFFYYNQILGLSGTLAGIAVTVGIFSDALT